LTPRLIFAGNVPAGAVGFKWQMSGPERRYRRVRA
jgi:hypothetical protein